MARAPRTSSTLKVPLPVWNAPDISTKPKLIAHLKGKVTGVIPTPTKGFSEENIRNMIMYGISLSIPEVIAETLSQETPLLQSDLATFAAQFSNSRHTYSVEDMGGAGTFMEKLFFGLNKDSKIFADINFTDLYSTLTNRQGVLGYNLLRSRAAKNTIQRFLKGAYYQELYSTVNGVSLLNEDIETAGIEMKTSSDFKKGLTVGKFTLAKSLTNHDEEVLIAALRKIYSKMSTLFIMATEWGQTSSARKRKLVIKAAAVFYELIYDKLLSAFTKGIIIVERRRQSGVGFGYVVKYNFKKLDAFNTIAQNSVAMVAEMGIYKHRVDMWTDAASRKEFFLEVLEYMRNNNIVRKGIGLGIDAYSDFV